MTLSPESTNLFFAMDRLVNIITKQDAAGAFQGTPIVLLTRILFFDKKISN
jgi:hypothetical protein